ncbi:hypothetical protein BC833DRAFT_527723 [Globomyces pollinis-pini]|nr:hypothetical protein BC833DRAFT_527723 [Globomyces pollinis-pini]
MPNPLNFSAKSITDLTNKTYLITGGNTGIGYECCKQLALKNATVILAARSEERAMTAIQKLKQETNDQIKIEFLKLDLANLKQVKSASDEVLKKHPKIDCLINNAGIMAPPFALTVDGIESQFGTNHVGHYLLTRQLLPALSKSSEPRIVNVSSSYHDKAPPEGIVFESINDEKRLDIWGRYGQSKLSNMLFTRGLHKRYPTIWSYTVHPGFVDTELTRGPVSSYGILFAPIIAIVKKISALKPEDGALTQLFCATSDAALKDSLNGEYFVPIANHVKPVHQRGEDDQLADKLWDFTEKLVNEKLNL